LISERQRRGSVFTPMHWTDQFASNARVDALVGGATDPISGQPELKFTPVSARRYAAVWYGFAVSVRPLVSQGTDYFAIAPAKKGWRAELAGLAAPQDWAGSAQKILALDPSCEALAYSDAASGQYRLVAFEAGRFVGALFVAREPVAVARAFFVEQLGREVPAGERLRQLSGRPGGETRDRGPMICACFDVGRNEILDAAHQGCGSVAAIGAKLKAGTNCGSCRGEIAGLLAGAKERSAI
jgi:assimilatory nitrate reductase catalytic subunit